MKAFLGTLVFTISVPGLFVVALPIMLGMVSSSARLSGNFAVGIVLLLVGAAIYVWAATAFVRKGKGTPAPIAPPIEFVVVGPYRYIRNPIYIGELIVVIGLAAIFGSALVLIYGGGLFPAFHLFVVGYEEPDLSRRFGRAYNDYVGEVGRWLPLRYLLKQKSA